MMNVLPPPPLSARSVTIGTTTVTIARITVAQGLKDRPVETRAAVTNELTQMVRLGVFKGIDMNALTPVERSRVIYSSIFLKMKMSPSGTFLKCKARLVAGGNRQDKTLYTNISSPTATPTAVQFVGGDAAHHGKVVASADIGTAYLNASMESTGVHVDMIIEARLASELAVIDPTLRPFLRRDGTCYVLAIE